MERSLSKKSKVLEDYVNKKADFPTSYFGPDDSVLSSLPDYGKSNAALPRGEDPSILPYKQIKAKENIMSRKITAKQLLKEVREIKKQASDDLKETLLELLNSGDPSQINQALLLNDPLGIFSDEEIGDLLIPKVLDGERNTYKHWKTLDGLGWFLLDTLPNHSMWDNLEEFNIAYAELTSIPKEIGNLTNLKRLDLRRNNLTSIPNEIGNLTNLKDLNLEGNNLTSLPKEIGNLKNLGKLELTSNKLTSLPKEIGNLNKLRLLELSFNNLTSLPKEIGNLNKLRRLRLMENNLTSLPKEIGNLTNLKDLNMKDNNLTSIPKEIGNLEGLEKFELRNNNLTSIPRELARTSLKKLWISGNNLTIDDVPYFVYIRFKIDI